MINIHISHNCLLRLLLLLIFLLCLLMYQLIYIVVAADQPSKSKRSNRIFHHRSAPGYILFMDTAYNETHETLQCDYSKTSTIDVLLCLDSHYEHSFVALMNSILLNSCNVSRLHFHILFDGQGEELDAFVGRFEKLFVFTSPAAIDTFRYEITSPYIAYPEFQKSYNFFHVSRSRLYKASNFVRFYFAQIFPTLHRGIYLDSDMIVQTDIAHLLDDYELNATHPVYAVLTPNKKTWDLRRLVTNKEKTDLFMDKVRPLIDKYDWISEDSIRTNVLRVDTPIMNGGLFVLNLDYWREHQLSQQMEELVRIKAETRQSLFSAGNQLIYNLIFRVNQCEIGSLPKYWNLWGLARKEWCKNKYMTNISRQILSDAYILHYADKFCKPWSDVARQRNLTVAKPWLKYKLMEVANATAAPDEDMELEDSQDKY